MSPGTFNCFITTAKPVIEVVADSVEVLFAVYAAAYGLDAYVKTKLEVANCPLDSHPDTISIPQSAFSQADMYGGNHRKHRSIIPPANNFEGRLEIVRFILETSRHSHAVSRSGAGRRLYLALMEKRKGEPGTRQQIEFLEEVERLLRLHGYQHENV